MKNHYVTFGQDHIHRVNGKTLDCDCVAVFKAENAVQGREKAFELFDGKFCFEYHGEEWREDKLKYFPGGYVYID